MGGKSGQMIGINRQKTATNFYSSPLEKSSAQESREYIKMKSRIEKLTKRSLTGNSICDFVVLGELFLETKEQLEETQLEETQNENQTMENKIEELNANIRELQIELEKTQNTNQAMENKIAELNANIRELQIKLDRLTQGIEPSQKEEEESKKSLEKKEYIDYNSSRKLLAENENRKILEDFLSPMSPRRVILDSSPSNVNLFSTLRQIVSGMLLAEIKINALSKENLNLCAKNSCLRNEINELKQKERKLED
ncbi:MAG: hypothetical protein CfP315_0080 [Candidatus Improbicoccus pseudotrichonymphae]|uniref:Uncharacterized protein n=1 Tax=Candidatus Improbicoccus pseudotrichonymphae TaxID=3033792 RepID=A0AA48HXN2_9FIRM|nr:MAG: hypothetical protein CfP315_0080 [Candidatus Improbicoccus pseudotrichonymphae]